MKLICALIVSFFVVLPGFGRGTGEGMTPAELSDLYSQAKRLFNEANEVRRVDGEAIDLYKRSLLYFERIVDEGMISNGRLFYNIGNIYFRLGDIGRAILNYRRAARFIPNDINLVQNLDYARSRRIDRIEASERTMIARILFFWHFDLSTGLRAVLCVISFVVVWVFAGLRLVSKHSGLVWAAVAFSILAMLFFGSLAWDSIDARKNLPGVVLVEEVIGRKGNSDTYQPSFQEPLHAGTEFVLREMREDWVLVELADGRRTWLPRSAVGLV
jgi:tetratricopeptide (TPR) repeat protein